MDRRAGDKIREAAVAHSLVAHGDSRGRNACAVCRAMWQTIFCLAPYEEGQRENDEQSARPAPR